MSRVVRDIKILNDGEMAYKMPSSYSIERSTNIYKILQIFTEEINEFIKACYGCEDVQDLDKKNGLNLDLYGSDFDITRDGLSDLNYLNKIKAYIYSRGSLGDENEILEALGNYFSVSSNLFNIERTDIRKINILTPGELTPETSKEIVKSVKAAGIRMEITPDKYWSDLDYEAPLASSIASLEYDKLNNYRYERKVVK